ncbi:zinc finger protein 729 [Lingula anatina]|uniref:Zinc finger protein 729 n=1 Tax=Lingula anatina TaxID=7574 RepID=A0A1S3K139_LINAN|nr:zinc finger protein 729 [Lingula anatina]|eukprot:XP_013416348.1 zinc finger protein 729 [Lingula anatina]
MDKRATNDPESMEYLTAGNIQVKSEAEVCQSCLDHDIKNIKKEEEDDCSHGIDLGFQPQIKREIEGTPYMEEIRSFKQFQELGVEIKIGQQLPRWNALKDQLQLNTHEKLAEFLMDFYFKHTSETVSPQSSETVDPPPDNGIIKNEDYVLVSNYKHTSETLSPQSSEIVVPPPDSKITKNEDSVSYSKHASETLFPQSSEIVDAPPDSGVAENEDSVRHSARFIHKCEVCGKQFITKSSLLHHVDDHSKRKFHCEICGMSFKRSFHAKNHKLSKHSTERNFECPTCRKKFKRKDVMKRHMRLHDVTPSECPKCKKKFKDYDSMKNHMRLHDLSPSDIKCCEWGSTLTSEKARYQRRSVVAELFPADDVIMPDNLLPPNVKPSVAKTFKEHWNCIRTRFLRGNTKSSRGKRLQDWYNFRLTAFQPNDLCDHLVPILEEQRSLFKVRVSFGFILRNNKTGALQYQHTSSNSHCILKKPAKIQYREDIDEIFGDVSLQDVLGCAQQDQPSGEWVVEMVTNVVYYVTKLKPKVKYDPKCFLMTLVHDLDLIRHSARNHKCEVCGKQFNTKSSLLHHADDHRKRKFLCEICGMSFKRSIHIKNHKLSKHSKERDFECPTCRKKFKRKDNMKRHMGLHDVTPSDCPKCKKKFKDYDRMKNHMCLHDVTLSDIKCCDWGSTLTSEKARYQRRSIVAELFPADDVIMPDNLLPPNVNPLVAKTFKEHWNCIRTRFLRGNTKSLRGKRLQDWYNFRLTAFQPNDLRDHLVPILEEKRSVIKINVSFGFILRNNKTGALRYQHTSSNSHCLLKMPAKIQYREDIDEIFGDVSLQDVLGCAQQDQPSGEWVVEMVTNVVFHVAKLKPVL